MPTELAKKCLKHWVLILKRSDPAIPSKNKKIPALFRFYSHGPIKTGESERSLWVLFIVCKDRWECQVCLWNSWN